MNLYEATGQTTTDVLQEVKRKWVSTERTKTGKPLALNTKAKRLKPKKPQNTHTSHHKAKSKPKNNLQRPTKPKAPVPLQWRK